MVLARIQTIHEESVVVGQVVIKSHRTPAQHKTVSDAYTNVVRNHLGLFNLTYNEETQMIYRLLDAPDAVNDGEEPAVYQEHTPPNSPPPPPKRRRIRADQLAMMEARRYGSAAVR